MIITAPPLFLLGQDNHPAPLFYHMNYFCGSISIQ